MLETATIEYHSRLCVCASVCVSVCVHDNSKTNESISIKLEHIVVHGNCSDDIDIGHCPIKVKVTAIQTVMFYISALAHVRKLWLSMCVQQIIINIQNILIL